MSALDEIIDRTCAASGADFAFVLTRRGRLATRNAPQDMPEPGRLQLVAVAEELLERGGELRVVSMPRQALVPFGGAAPVDVYVAARADAVVCVVLATYSPQERVPAAITAGLEELDQLLDSEASRRARRRGRAQPSKPPPAAKSTRSGRKSQAPPALDFDDTGRGTIPFLQPYRPGKKTPPPPPSAPDIIVSEAKVGRATLAAIEVDLHAPEITYGVAPIGRATMAEIELEAVPRGDPRSSLPQIEIDVEIRPDLDPEQLAPEDRHTLPFVESADDSKRAFERSRAATVSKTSARTVIVGRSTQRPPAMPAAPRPQAEPSRPSARDSGVDVWRRALDDLVTEEPKKKRSTIAPPGAKPKKPPAKR